MKLNYVDLDIQMNSLIQSLYVFQTFKITRSDLLFYMTDELLKEARELRKLLVKFSRGFH